MFRTLNALPALLLACAGCMSAGEHQADVRSDAAERLTVGTVQREIRIGMPGADVVRALGAPNVVTTDEERHEVWVYDKVATETVYSSSSGGVAALILAGSGDVAGAGGAGMSRSAGASSRSQRTLTIVVRMDGEGRVRDFSYRASQF